MQCPHCNSERCYKIGRKDYADGAYQRWRCSDCKKIIKGERIVETTNEPLQ